MALVNVSQSNSCFSPYVLVNIACSVIFIAVCLESLKLPRKTETSCVKYGSYYDKRGEVRLVSGMSAKL